MTLYGWDDRYAIGVAALDEQHRKLFGLIAKLHRAVKGGEYTAALGEVLPELVRYTEYHFSEEESFMKRYEYPHLLEQVNAHRRFIKEVAECRARITEQSFGVALKLLGFLNDWLVEHIGAMDRKLAPFLKERIGARDQDAGSEEA